MPRVSSVEAPFVIATLPKSPHSAAGRTLTAVVKTFKAPRWRKRPEVVVAVDGEGISLYNVRDSRQITSYALPPHSRFVCPPCSVYRRTSLGNSVQRLTYAAVRQGSESSIQLVCFVEESVKGLAADLGSVLYTKHTSTPSNINATIADLSPLAAISSGDGQDQAPALCVTHSDASFECLDAHLKQSLWTSDNLLQAQQDGHPVEVSYLTLLDIDSACKGLLRGRADATATLQRLLGQDAAATSHSLAVTITTTLRDDRPTKRHLYCFLLPAISTSRLSSALRHPIPILDYPLLGPPRQHGRVQYELLASTGTLFQLLPGSLTTISLSGTLPLELSSVPSLDQDFQSFKPFTPWLVSVCTSSACKIIDVTHCSQQAARDINIADQLLNDRRSSSSTSTKPHALRTVSYFSELSMLVALQGHNLVAFQLNMAKPGHRHDLVRETLLADAFGRGLPVASKPKVANIKNARPDTQQELAWTEWQKNFDQLADDGNVVELERFLARDLHISRGRKVQPAFRQNDQPKDDGSISQPQATNGETLPNSEHSAVVDKTAWCFPNDNSYLIGRTKRKKALHCLRKLFVLDKDSNGHHNLSVALYAQEALTWLAMTGYLTASALQDAFADDSQGLAPRIGKGQLAQAFIDLDPTFGVMHDFLNLPVRIDAEEVVETLKAVIQSLESPSTSYSSQKLLMTPSDAVKDSQVSEDTVAEESEAAEADLAFALASLNDGLTVRSGVLGVVFSRLTSFPPTTMVQLLRSCLSEQEIVFLITLLRIELADGGWTTLYQDELDDAETADAFSNQSINVIAKLLNIAVDAVGTSGWLVGLAGDPGMSTDEMLLVLRAETTAALEGCFQADMLKTHLNDFDRYCKRHNEANISKPAKRRKMEQHDTNEDDPSLPLGFKVDTIDSTTVSKGGKVRQKSKNALDKALSMKVGRYTIDRIQV